MKIEESYALADSQNRFFDGRVRYDGTREPLAVGEFAPRGAKRESARTETRARTATRKVVGKICLLYF